MSCGVLWNLLNVQTQLLDGRLQDLTVSDKTTICLSELKLIIDATCVCVGVFCHGGKSRRSPVRLVTLEGLYRTEWASTRWTDTPSHSICCFYMLHRTRPHNWSTYSASAQTQRKFPPAVFSSVSSSFGDSQAEWRKPHTFSSGLTLGFFIFCFVFAQFPAELAERRREWSISGLQMETAEQMETDGPPTAKKGRTVSEVDL